MADSYRIRLMRGQVVIREDFTPHTHAGSILIPGISNIDNPNAVARRRTWHIGEVLGIGKPALDKWNHEVPYGFDVGDRVIFHFIHNEDAHTRDWSDGKRAVWIPQMAVDCVVG